MFKTGNTLKKGSGNKFIIASTIDSTEHSETTTIERNFKKSSCNDSMSNLSMISEKPLNYCDETVNMPKIKTNSFDCEPTAYDWSDSNPDTDLSALSEKLKNTKYIAF